MIFLPIVGRELRVASRRSATYWGRVVMALVAVAVWLWVMAEELASPSLSSSGAKLFSVLGSVALGYSLLAGLRGAAESLCQEKQQGTLGLLFLTDLKGYDVVFGKLAATSLGAFYGVVAILPILAIPILMGGVAAGTFWRLALLLLNTLFFSVSSGLFVSSISRVARKAVGGTLLLVLGVAAGLPLIGFALAELTGQRAVSIPFLLPSPIYALFLMVAPAPMTMGRIADFWPSMAMAHILSWGLLGLASWIAPHSWKDKPPSVKRLRWREWWGNLVLGSVARRHAFRARLLEINAIYWLSSRERQTASYPWIFLVSMVAIALPSWALDPSLWAGFGVAFFITYLLHLFFKCWVLTLACQSFAKERENGAMELLLSTPLTVSELLRGQWLAMRRQFLLPVIAILLFDLVWMCLVLRWRMRHGLEPANILGFYSCLANMLVFAADLVALFWVGMWMGLSVRRTSRAAPLTMARLLFFPAFLSASVWVILLLIGVILELSDADASTASFVFAWLFVGIIMDIIYGRRAYWKLRHELRTAASQRFSATVADRAP